MCYPVRRFAVAVVLLFICFASEVCADASRLRVLSLNAQWFPGREPDAAPAQQARHIASLHRLFHDLNPDLCLIQEVNRTDALIRALAVLPDMALYTVSAFTDSPQQLAIAGRLPLVMAGTSGWPVSKEGVAPPRGIAFSEVELSDRSVLLIFTVHLKSNFRGAEKYNEAQNRAMRETAVRLFVDYAVAKKAAITDRIVRGVLLGGDFNTIYPRSVFRGERTARILENAGFLFMGSDGLDHFWSLGITNAFFSAFSEYTVSDHHPVTLDIDLPDGVTVSRRSPLPLADVASLAGDIRTDINTAQRGELMSLPGIGPVLTDRIILQRPFHSIGHLVDVCGIGRSGLKKVLPYIKVLPPEDASP